MPNITEVLGNLDRLVEEHNWAADKAVIVLGKYEHGYRLMLRIDNKLITLHTGSLIISGDATNDWFNNTAKTEITSLADYIFRNHNDKICGSAVDTAIAQLELAQESNTLLSSIEFELKDFVNTKDTGLLETIKDIIVNYNWLDELFEIYSETMRQIHTELDKSVSKGTVVIDRIKELTCNHITVSNELSNNIVENKKLRQDFKALTEEFEALDSELVELAGSHRLVNEEYGKLNQKYRELERLYNDAAKRVKRLNGSARAEEIADVADKLGDVMVRGTTAQHNSTTTKLSTDERASIQQYCNALRKVAKAKMTSEDETAKIDSDGGNETLFNTTITSFGGHKTLGHDGTWTWNIGYKTGNT